MDKIIYLKQGQASLTDVLNGLKFNLKHNLPATPFISGVWTPDNWNTTYNFGAQIYDGGVISLRSSVTSNKTDIEVFVSTPNTATIQYVLWGFWNEDQTKDLKCPPTATDANKLVFSSQFNYPRLIKEGYADKNSSVAHNLGHIPFVDIWASYDGTNWYKFDEDGFGTVYGFGEWVKLYSDRIEFSNNSGSASKFYYRIYD
ncbi:hypothetical protein [Sharpea azabuensis]